MPIQTPGSYEDEADEVAKRLVEGESDADEAKPAVPAPAPASTPEKKDEPGPYGMTMAAWKALGPEGQWASEPQPRSMYCGTAVCKAANDDVNVSVSLGTEGVCSTGGVSAVRSCA
jgi:hypothetical protein